jgi:DNA-binding MarR family transcriptional regulator
MRKSVDNVNHMDSAATADAVLELVHTVMHQFRSLQFQALRDGPHDVTHMESKVMAFFSAHPGATLSDLAQHSGRDKAQLARLVKGLRERELLVGEPDPADRRNIRLALSAAGNAVQQALRRKARSLNGRAVDGLTAEQQRALVALLSQLKANLDGLE